MARIVFDLDGTLIDSAPDLRGIANEIMAEMGLEQITLAEAREFIGKGAAMFVAQLREARDIAGGEQERILAAFQSRYMTAVELTRPYPGVEAALKSLITSGHSLGICTNKPIRPTKAVLKHLALEHYFETVWGGDSMTVHKPDPAPLDAAFDALGQGDEIYVGDSEVDAETARSAMVPFLLYTEGYRESPVSIIAHTASFSDFTDLPNLVEAMLAQPVT